MNKKGYTLIELVIAILLAGIIVGVLGLVVNSGMDAWFFVRSQGKGMMETRSAMNRVVREIRSIKGNANSNILVFNDSRFRFLDINDAIIDYEQDGNDLLRNDVVILNNLLDPGGLSFTYLNSAGNPTTAKSAVRCVRIKLRVVDGSNQVRLQSSASLRNR